MLTLFTLILCLSLLFPFNSVKNLVHYIADCVKEANVKARLRRERKKAVKEMTKIVYRQQLEKEWLEDMEKEKKS